jgi:hypothetical protein
MLDATSLGSLVAYCDFPQRLCIEMATTPEDRTPCLFVFGDNAASQRLNKPIQQLIIHGPFFNTYSSATKKIKGELLVDLYNHLFIEKEGTVYQQYDGQLVPVDKTSALALQKFKRYCLKQISKKPAATVARLEPSQSEPPRLFVFGGNANDSQKLNKPIQQLIIHGPFFHTYRSATKKIKGELLVYLYNYLFIVKGGNVCRKYNGQLEHVDKSSALAFEKFKKYVVKQISEVPRSEPPQPSQLETPGLQPTQSETPRADTQQTQPSRPDTPSPFPADQDTANAPTFLADQDQYDYYL